MIELIHFCLLSKEPCQLDIGSLLMTHASFPPATLAASLLDYAVPFTVSKFGTILASLCR